MIVASLSGDDVADLYGNRFRRSDKEKALVGQYDCANGGSVELIFRNISSLADIHPFCHPEAHAYALSVRPHFV